MQKRNLIHCRLGALCIMRHTPKVMKRYGMSNKVAICLAHSVYVRFGKRFLYVVVFEKIRTGQEDWKSTNKASADHLAELRDIMDLEIGPKDWVLEVKPQKMNRSC